MDTQPREAKVHESVRALLAGAIDYAGLFPPSQLAMSDAVLNYATYRNSNYVWMLGRFVVTAARLDEFYESAADFITRDVRDRWHIAVVAGEDIVETLKHAGLKTYPYHVYVPSFGEWGFVLAGLYPYEPPAALPVGLRFLSARNLQELFHFPNDMLPVDVEPNRLNDQVLVRYYEHEWRDIAH